MQYVGFKNGLPYCRKCISFQGKEVDIQEIHPRNGVDFLLKYELSEEQQQVAKDILNNYTLNINTLVYAVCGAGKTELVFEVIKHVLSKGGYVGFATPRRDVAIEIYPRIKDAFKMCKVTLVHGGRSEVLIGDIVILTTHQLYRYKKFFNLVIVDEIDAFPYKGNDVLRYFMNNSLKGNYVLLTATPSKEDLNNFSKPGFNVVTLLNRFHHKPIPVPKVFIGLSVINFIAIVLLIRRYIKERKPCLVFVATIKECEKKYRLLKFFFKNGNYVHSKRKKREQIIHEFKNFKLDFLVTTAVLERGVTIKNLQVIVYNSDHAIYDAQSLVQISGRVGRKLGAEKGEVTFFANEKTGYMDDAIKEIEFANQNLQNLLKKL